jgi:hypothetical protein
MADGHAALNNIRFIIQICRGVIRSHRVRRTLMFYDVLAVLLLIFAGSTFLWSWLRERPLLFLGYWAACGWLTILAALLAIYDMARVRIEARRAAEQLRDQYFSEKKDSGPPHDSDAS